VPGPLPPPQQPPSPAAAEIIDQIRSLYDTHPTPADLDELGTDTAVARWLQVLEDLRNIAVDAEALWEQALQDAKEFPDGETSTGPIVWDRLTTATGIVRQSIISRVKDRPARRTAAKERVPRYTPGLRAGRAPRPDTAAVAEPAEQTEAAAGA
jgi:hypothetical protein